MVKRAFELFHREIRGVSHAAYFLAGFSLLSQLLALLRDRMFAATFGANQTLDLYYAAFRIPDFIFVVVSSLVSVSVIIPLIQSHLASGKSDPKEARDFLSNIFSAFFVIIGGAALVAFFLAPYVVPALFPNFAGKSHELVLMTRIMLLSPIFLGISNLFASITQAKQRFILYALCPVAYNVGIIIGVLVFYRIWGSIYGLAAGVVLGALLHALIQLPYAIREGLAPRFRWIDWRGVWNVARISLPRTLSLSVSELTEFGMTIIAGVLVTGSISIFNLSWNLQSVPLSIIGVSYSIALFPILSKLVQDGGRALFLEKVLHTTRQILFLGAITTAVFIVVRAQIVRTILGSGEFNWNDTRLTAAALALFVISLVPQCLILVITRAFYALGNTRTPFFANLFASVVMLSAGFFAPHFYTDYAFVRNSIAGPLKVLDVSGGEVLLLPLIFSIGSFLNMGVLAFLFNRQVPGFLRSLVKPLGIQLTAACIAALAGHFCLYAVLPAFETEHVLGIFGQGLIAGLFAIFAAVAFLYFIKNAELAELIASVTRSKRRPIAGADTSM